MINNSRIYSYKQNEQDFRANVLISEIIFSCDREVHNQAIVSTMGLL